jgi:hypothetical protein
MATNPPQSMISSRPVALTGLALLNLGDNIKLIDVNSEGNAKILLRLFTSNRH